MSHLSHAILAVLPLLAQQAKCGLCSTHAKRLLQLALLYKARAPSF